MASVLFAGPVTKEQAQQIASQFLTGKGVSHRAPSPKQLKTEVVLNAVDKSGQPYLYAVTQGEEDGFVIVCGDNRFRIVDKGQGQVVLQCEDGRYVFTSGQGMAGDVRLTGDASQAEVFMWQDYLDHEFMLMSMRTHRYLGKSPTTGSPYSMDFTGSDPARRNGAVFRWE
jgi:hypothetical protein